MTGFKSEAQRRAVFAILSQRMTGVKPSLTSRLPFSAESRFRRLARNKPRTAGVLYATAKKQMRVGLLNEASTKYKRKRGQGQFTKSTTTANQKMDVIKAAFAAYKSRKTA